MKPLEGTLCECSNPRAKLAQALVPTTQEYRWLCKPRLDLFSVRFVANRLTRAGVLATDDLRALTAAEAESSYPSPLLVSVDGHETRTLPVVTRLLRRSRTAPYSTR